MEAIIVSFLRNKVFMIAALGWFTAQTLKFIFALSSDRSIDFKYFVSTGGMPSSHSSFVTSLATAIGLQHGWDSAIFALALGFAIVVMYDAAGVRRAAGKQAEILNTIVEEMFKTHKIAERKLRELLGHTPIEVFAGAILGVVLAFILFNRF